MLKRSLYFLLLVCLMALAGGIQAQDSAIELTISGVNGADTQQWLNDNVKPAFEQMMADRGQERHRHRHPVQRHR